MFGEKEVLRFYSDFPNQEALAIWYNLNKQFGQSAEALEAKWRMAKHWSGQGKFDKAAEFCDVALVLIKRKLNLIKETLETNDTILTVFSPPADTVMSSYKLTELAIRLEKLASLISGSNHTDNENSKLHLAKFVMLNPYGMDYSTELDKLLGQTKGKSPLRDNILIWDYVVNYRHYFLPHPNFNVLQKNIQILRDAGVKAILEQANGQGYGSEFEGLRAWVLTKLLWNPDADMRLLIVDYINGYYQKSAPYILRYFDLVQSLVTDDSYLTYATKLDNPVFTPEFLKKANKIFDKAEAAAGNEEILHRIEIARLGVIFMNIAADYSQADKDAELTRLIEITNRENIVWSSEGWQTTKLIDEIKKRMIEE